MRILKPTAAAILLLAAAPAFAKPVAGGSDAAAQAAYRHDLTQSCIVLGAPLGGPQPAGEALRAACGCAVDRFMADRATETLPPAVNAVAQGMLYDDLRSCIGDPAPGDANADVPAAERPAGSKPDAVPEESRNMNEGGPTSASFPSRVMAWIDGTGLPRPAWIGIALLALVLLRLLFRRRDSNDLIAPPRSMRPGSTPGPRRPPSDL